MDRQDKTRKTIDFRDDLITKVQCAGLPGVLDKFLITFTDRIHYLIDRGISAVEEEGKCLPED